LVEPEEARRSVIHVKVMATYRQGVFLACRGGVAEDSHPSGSAAADAEGRVLDNNAHEAKGELGLLPTCWEATESRSPLPAAIRRL
jgi:hypothetical protein